MSKTWKIVISCVAVALVALTVTLLCVFLIDRKPYKVTGEGTVEMTQTENGETMLTAKPDKWQSFAGWYVVDEETGELSKSPVSTESVMVLGEDAPRYTAVFKASTLDALDRTLSGVYQKYSAGIEAEKDYFNFAGDIDLDVRVGDTSPLTLNVKAGGYFNFSGLGNEFYLSVTPQGNETVLFAIYYVDSVSEAKLYTNIAGEMNTYNFISLSQLVTEIPALSDHIWSIKNILYGAIDNPETVEKIYSVVEKFLGVANSQGVCGEAINSKNSSTFSLRLDVLLQTIEPLLGTLDINSEILDVLSEVIDGLTKEYTGTNFLPMIMLDFTVNYETAGDVEYVDSIGLNFSIDEDYNVNFGEVTTVEDMEISLNVKDIELGFAESKNGVDSTILELFPEAKNLLNVDIAGTLTFYTETATDDTTSVLNPTDVYDVSIMTDINVGALSNAISKNGFDYTKIDWDNLGFLSISVILDDEVRSNGHSIINNDKEEEVIEDYINIFIDTEKYGPTAYVYAGMYNPNLKAKIIGEIDVTRDYILNMAYDIPSLVEYFVEKDSENVVGAQSNNSTNPTELNVFELITSVIEIISTKDFDTTKLVYTVLAGVLPTIENEDVQSLVNQISYSETDGLVLKLADVRTMINGLLTESQEGEESSFDISTLGIKLDTIFFGENATHLALKLGDVDFGVVERASAQEGLGDYLNHDGVSIIEDYNSKHLTMKSFDTLLMYENNDMGNEPVDISGQSFFTKENYLEQLAEISLFAGNIEMSDGSILQENKLQNSSGSPYDVNVYILGDVEVIEETENYAKIRLSLRRALPDYLMLASLIGVDLGTGFEDLLYNKIGLPFGVYTVETTINFAEAEVA